MTLKVSIRFGLGGVALLACGLAFIIPAFASSGDASGGLPAAPIPASTPLESPGVVLNPEKAAFESEVVANQARAASAMADPATRSAVLAQKAAEKAAARADAGKAHQQQDIRATCPVGLEPGQPPLSSFDFLATGGQIHVILGQCVRVYVGYLGLDHPTDGAVFFC